MSGLEKEDFRNLSKDDLLRINQLCERLHRVKPHESFLNHCFVILNQALGDIHFAAELYQLHPFKLLEREVPPGAKQALPSFAEHTMKHPYAQRMMDTPSIDISMPQPQSTEDSLLTDILSAGFDDKIQAPNQIWISLRNGNEVLACIYSRDAEYTERNLAMLCLIQPQLELAWQHWNHVRSLQQDLELYRTGARSPAPTEKDLSELKTLIGSLTRRQRQVTELVASGSDNQQIADELNISKRTVHKHLEMVYLALDIHHRTELAATWHKAHNA